MDKAKINMILRNIFSWRTLIYIAGNIVLALGITLNTKTGLGSSPIISVPYNISIISGADLGILTFIFYVSFVALQILLLGKQFKIYQLLQIPMCFITSSSIGLYDKILPMAEGWPAKIMMLILGIVITGIGAAITVGMKIVPNPADGLANVIGMKLHKDFGFGKNVFDFISLIISLAIGLIFTGGIIGIGLGTVAAMILTGRVIAIAEKPVAKLFDAVKLK